MNSCKSSLHNTPLERILIKALGIDFYKGAEYLSAITPYDRGTIYTSEHQFINPGDDCTCLILAKVKDNWFFYIAIYSKTSGKKPSVFDIDGFPIYAKVSQGPKEMITLTPLYRKGD